MKLKTKLTLSLSLLVLVVVLGAAALYVDGLVRQQLQAVYTQADFVSRHTFNEVRSELDEAVQSGKVDLRQPAQVGGFFAGLAQSRALNTFFSSAIGYPSTSAIRDVAVEGPAGTIVADSNPLLVGTALPPRPLLQPVIAYNGWDRLSAIFSGHRIYEVRLPLQLGAQPLGAIRVGVDTVLLREALAGRIRGIAETGLLLVALATLLAVIGADLLLSPLGAISVQLDQVARGEAGPGPLAGRHDEYGAVASKIEMIGRQMRDVRHIYTTLQENVGQVLESLEEGLLLFDAQGVVLMASGAAQRLLGIPAGMVGQPVEAIFPSDNTLDRAVRLAVRHREILPAREIERAPGGRRLLIRLDLLQDRSGQAGALLVARDAERVHRLEDELELARRLSAIGRLSRGVAHEVKNPLNAMAIHLDLLETKAGADNGLGLHIQVLRHEIERLDRVVKTFLDFSRPVEMHLAEADLVTLLGRLRDLAAAGAEAQGVEIAVECRLPSLPVWIDRDLIEQALLNLINNGVEAMADSPGRRRLELLLDREGDTALLRVRDHGPGVPPEFREKIFDLYFTTRPQGTGIGLALTARIMQVHHGSVELETNLESGASFLVRLPLRRGEAVALPAEVVT